MGEYAVLEGHPGTVMAVDRYAVVHRAAGDSPADREEHLVERARSRAADLLMLDRSPGSFEADSSAFHLDGVKLGIGSSAAVTVCSVASVFRQAGEDLESEPIRRRLWDVCLDIHDSFQGIRGSGLDIAASIFGGCTTVIRNGPDRTPDFLPWTWPKGLRPSFVWTGHEASTPELVRAVRSYAERSPGACRTILEEMGATSASLATGVSDVVSVLESVKRYASLMADLGTGCGAPIVTEPMDRLFELAAEAGGAAKPSGAGGGDLVIAFFGTEGDEARFRRNAEHLGMTPIDFRVAPVGVHARVRGEDGGQRP